MQQIVIEGQYNGKNLYVQNPYSANGVGFCTIEVRVNGRVTADAITASAYEIDLSVYNLKLGDPVTVAIYHKDGCMPKVLNPEVLKPLS